MSSTKLSVIMPVYNGMPFIKEAITSLLNQSYQNFIIYAIDNGSDDGTSEYLNQINDIRINYVILEENNLVKALNIGLGMVNTPFIARMDADDISQPTRFEKQMKYLLENRSVDLVGTLGQYISVDGNKHFNINLPLTHDDIIDTMVRTRNAIIHPSIMFRSEITTLSGGYNENYSDCEDFELFLRIGNKIKFANLPERLHSLRIRDGSIMTDEVKKRINQYYLVSKLYAHKYNNHHIAIEQPENFHLNLVEKLDVLSVSMYRKGLHYYLNVSKVIGIMLFIVASIMNPLRSISAVKGRISFRSKIKN
ncbi:MAG: glycosyltransferase [Ignavibacteria bacterium]|nr:glycosyltransferase [Ignavibacteria bacterium]